MDRKKLHSFNTLYTLYYKRSFLFTKSYVHNDLAAEDIASESLIKLWETINKEEVLHPQSLLLTILRNKSLDYLKHMQVRQDAFSSISNIYQQDLTIRISTLEACNPEEIFSNEIQEIIRKSLNSLPEQTKKIFEMSRFENLSGKEISEKLGLSTKSVEYHITKALKVLRANLKDYLPLFYFLFS